MYRGRLLLYGCGDLISVRVRWVLRFVQAVRMLANAHHRYAGAARSSSEVAEVALQICALPGSAMHASVHCSSRACWRISRDRVCMGPSAVQDYEGITVSSAPVQDSIMQCLHLEGCTKTAVGCRTHANLPTRACSTAHSACCHPPCTLPPGLINADSPSCAPRIMRSSRTTRQSSTATMSACCGEATHCVMTVAHCPAV